MEGGKGYEISPARSVEDFEAAKQLFSDYKDSVAIDLGFQNYDAEIAAMPGKYAPPMGELLLARDCDRGCGDVPIGCVGLRPLDRPGWCEMKRLFVKPTGRGAGLGRALVERVIHAARRLGYREMRLDTLATMTPAISLYQRFGFVPTEAYYRNPLENVQYMVLHL